MAACSLPASVRLPSASSIISLYVFHRCRREGVALGQWRAHSYIPHYSANGTRTTFLMAVCGSPEWPLFPAVTLWLVFRFGGLANARCGGPHAAAFSVAHGSGETGTPWVPPGSSAPSLCPLQRVASPHARVGGGVWLHPESRGFVMCRTFQRLELGGAVSRRGVDCRYRQSTVAHPARVGPTSCLYVVMNSRRRAAPRE